MHSSINIEFFSWTCKQSSSCGNEIQPFVGLPYTLLLIQSWMSNIFNIWLINAVVVEVFKITLSGLSLESLALSDSFYMKNEITSGCLLYLRR